MSEQQPLLAEPLDTRAAEDLDHLHNFVPESLADAEQTADMLREGYTGRENDIEDESLRHELAGRLEAGVDMWKLSTNARQEQESVVATQNWQDLSAGQRAEMKRLKPDVYASQGLAFAKLKEQAEKRLQLDDEIKAREMEVAAEQEVRDNYAKGHAAVRAEIDAAKADKEKEAFKLRMKYGSNMRPDVAAALESKSEPMQSAKAPVEKRVIDPNVNREQVHANSNATTEALRNFYRTQLTGETPDTTPAATTPDVAPDAKTVARHLEAHRAFTDMDLLQFSDNEMGFSYSEPGTEIVFGIGSSHKYASNLPFEKGSHRAIVYTADGEKYGFGAGHIIKMSTGEAVDFPQGDDLKFTVGEKFKLPGADEETVVEEVLIRGETGPEGFEHAEQVPGGNPFTRLRERIADISVAESTKIMPAVPAVAAVAAVAASQPAAPQPNVQKAPAPEKRKGRKLLAVLGTLAVGAALLGGLAALDGEDAPHKEAAQNTLDLKDDQNRSDRSVEQGKTVSITVEAGNGPTQEIKELAEEQGIQATPQQLYDTYKKFADQGRFDDIDGMYRMANGDFGFASTGAHELPADLVADMLEDLKKSTS
jgi:hypothetical protein